MHLRRLALAAALALGSLLPSAAHAQSDETAFQIARDGEAAAPVIVRPDAGEAVEAAAQALATELGRITGGEFTVREDAEAAGIIVARFEQLPEIDREVNVDPSTPIGRETYLLRSSDEALIVAGATDLAVEHAVWDLLHRVGYRRFFPSPAWEVVPHEPSLSISVGTRQQPDYYHRRIWYGFGTAAHNRESYQQWTRRNRMVSGFKLSTGHSWGRIHSRNKEAFEQHPEYYALVDGERKFRGNSTKFCIANEDLRELVVADRVKAIAENGLRDSISIDPTDGLNWCECEPCEAIGQPSERLALLASETVEAIVEAHGPNHYVGHYAYAAHSPPPTKQKVHRNVIVSAATSFIRGGYTIEQLLSGWNDAGATMGIREYYSVHTWDRDLPGRARGARLEYLTRTIPDFHARGARFLTAESSDNWGPNGLGYYLASRILWSIDNAERADDIIDDFLTRAFGSAREPMRKFYGLINIDTPRLPVSEHLIARMYQHLDEASRATSNPAVQARLDELILYTRYVELHRAYSNASGDARQKAVEDLLRFSYSIRETSMVHVEPIFRDLPRRDRNVELDENMVWNVGEDENPLKQDPRPTRDQVQQILEAGLANNEALSFDPVAFDDELVPATPLQLEAPESIPPHRPDRGTRTWYTWVEEAPATIELTVTGGLIAHYRDRGDVRIELFPINEPFGESVASAAVPPDGEPRDVKLETEFTGLHRIEVADGSDMTRLEWADGLPMTRTTTLDRPVGFNGRYTMYFYVPRGTKVIGGFQTGNGGSIVGPDGEKRYTFERGGKFFEIDVPAGQDGQLWKLNHVGGSVALLTVPPQIARSPDELLLPKSVVEKDSGTR